MDYKFLDKVMNQILRETVIFEERDHIFVKYPFGLYGGISINLPVGMKWFLDHCREVYGLNNEESNELYYLYDNTIRNIYNKDNNYGGKLRKTK